MKNCRYLKGITLTVGFSMMVSASARANVTFVDCGNENIPPNAMLIHYDGKELRRTQKQNLDRHDRYIYFRFSGLNRNADNVIHIRFATTKINQSRASSFLSNPSGRVRLFRNKPDTACDPDKDNFRAGFFDFSNPFTGDEWNDVNRNDYYNTLRDGTKNSELLFGSRWGWHYEYDATNGSNTNCTHTSQVIEREYPVSSEPPRSAPESPSIDQNQDHGDDTMLLSRMYRPSHIGNSGEAYAATNEERITEASESVIYSSILINTPKQKPESCFKISTKSLARSGFSWFESRSNLLRTSVQIKRLPKKGQTRMINYSRIMLRWE